MKQYVVCATKMSPSMSERLNQAAAFFGLTKYQLIQSVLCAFLRCFDKGGPATDEMENFLQAILMGIESTSNSFNMCNPTAEPMPTKVIILNEDKNKPGERPQLSVMTRKGGEWEESLNFDEATEAVLASISPKLVRAVDDERDRNGGMTFTTALDSLLRKGSAAASRPDISAEVRELFSDNCRSDYGFNPQSSWYGKQAIEYGHKPKRGHTHSMEYFEDTGRLNQLNQITSNV